MSDPSGVIELEGDTDDLEGEADITEWTTLTSAEKKPGSNRQHSVKVSRGKERLEKTRSSHGKFTTAKENRTSTTRQAYRSHTNTSSSSASQNRNSPLPTKSVKKLPPKKQSGHSKNKTPSQVGDIAGVIGILDSSTKKIGEINSKSNRPDDEKKTDSGDKLPSKSVDLSAASVRKRKLSLNEDADSSKSKRIPDESNGIYKSPKEKEDKVEMTVLQHESEKDIQRKLSCSEEYSRNIDTELVEEMVGNIKQNMMPKYGDKYTVRFSPVELADLADETVQKLVATQPNMVFCFKRQGKLKKKKGYAEVYFSQIQEARIFLQKLIRIKLVEPHMDVTITVSKPKKDDEVLSLVICLDKNSQLLKLIKSTEDAAKVLPDAQKEHFTLEKVPASANALMLRTLFPFAAEVIFSTGKKKLESAYRGPVTVHYTSVLWLEAMLECCSDFTYSGYTLSVQHTRKKLETKTKPAADIKRDEGGVLERKSSAADKQDDSTKIVKEGNSSSGTHRSEAVGIPEDSSIDDDISHMTLDVCSGMMESLNKLRQLGTDNPNVLKILQMQNELATLQQSLSKDQSHKTSLDSQVDPWSVNATDDVDDKQDEKGQDKKPPKEQRKKQDKETRAEKQRKEMEDLQRMIEEAEEAKRQNEEKAKRQLEEEKQKMKDLDEKRKSTWARRMIEDAKQSAPLASGESTSKEEVQRILKIMGSRRKEAEEAKKLEEEVKGKVKEKLQTANTVTGQDASASLDSSIQSSQEGHHLTDNILAKQGLQDLDDGLPDKPETSEIVVEHPTQDNITEVKAWSPDRHLHDGAPIYSEEEFNQICSKNAADTIPWNHYIQVTYYADRKCPVKMCPSTKYFKTASSFDVHWDNFHKPNMTMKFCQKCSAYFTTAPELEAHLTNRHSVSDPQTVKKMSEEAREKIVSNPSYRDPGNYLPPVV